MVQWDEAAAVHRVGARLRESCVVKARAGHNAAHDVVRAARAVAATLEGGGKLLLFGNGGSAADAQHLAAEFVGRFVEDRRALPAVALSTDSSALTAIGNDYGFDDVFARQVEALGRQGDVAIGITTSGRSANVVRGLQTAQELGMTTVVFAGGSGQPAVAVADISILVPSTITARIQESHIAFGHIMCELVEELLLGRTRPVLFADRFDDKAVPPEALAERGAAWRAEGLTVAWTNGCFDVLHAGHVHSLAQAATLADVLVVGINTDDSVRQLKGPRRPLVPLQERMQVVAALECVDAVTPMADRSPEVLLRALQPDVHCKGEEYAQAGLPEADVVKEYGGRVVYLDMVPGISTSALMRRITGEEA